MSLLIYATNYKNHWWQIHANLKVARLLLGLKTGYKKYSCLCLCQATEKEREGLARYRPPFFSGNIMLTAIPWCLPKGWSSLHYTHEVCPKRNENDLKKLLHIHAITVYPLQNRLLVIEYSNSSVAATLHSNGGSLHLRCCSKPSSQLPGRFQLSQNDVLWGGFWAWGIKRNRTEPSQGCTVSGEALWYYREPKIPSQQLMCDLAHCRGEGTTCLQFHGRRAQLCFSKAQVPVGKVFDSQSVRVAQTPCEQLTLNQKKNDERGFHS